MFSIHTLALLLLSTANVGRPDVMIVQGAGGAAEYEQKFAEWSKAWVQAAEGAGARSTYIGGSDENTEESDLSRVQMEILAATKQEQRPLWIVLIGHGTFDGRDARFNLVGPDLSDRWLAEQLADCKRPLAVICCFSSSAPFLNRLSGEGRVVITATRSGAERNFSRFGAFMADAVGDGLSKDMQTTDKPSLSDQDANGEAVGSSKDLDKDGQTSLLELFLFASKRTSQFYADEQRLATEHPLMDDNGDRRGTPAEWFRGIQATRAPKEGQLDGLFASQQVLVPSARERNASPDFLKRRNSLERQLSELKKRRSAMDEDAYFELLEPLMIQMARLYEEE